MNVLRKDGADDHAYAGAGARDLYRRPDVGNRRFVDAADATPSVPDEVGIQLIGAVLGHGIIPTVVDARAYPALTPG